MWPIPHSIRHIIVVGPQRSTHSSVLLDCGFPEAEHNLSLYRLSPSEAGHKGLLLMHSLPTLFPSNVTGKAVNHYISQLHKIQFMLSWKSDLERANVWYHATSMVTKIMEKTILPFCFTVSKKVKEGGRYFGSLTSFILPPSYPPGWACGVHRGDYGCSPNTRPSLPAQSHTSSELHFYNHCFWYSQNN